MHAAAAPVVLKAGPAVASTGASDSQTILAVTLSAMRNTDGMHKSKSPTVTEITDKLASSTCNAMYHKKCVFFIRASNFLGGQ